MPRRAEIVDTLRQRVLTALHYGTMRPGSRLPSARSLAEELDADPRVVTSAFRQLVREGLVERRPGSRAHFVGRLRTGEGASSPAADWLAEVFVDGLARGVPAPDLPERVRRSIETVRLRALCVESNADHLAWLRGEMADDYGVASVGIEVDSLGDDDVLLPAARSADLLVTTAHHADAVREVAVRLRKPLVVVTIRPDLIADIHRRLATGPVYFVGTDARVAQKLRLIFDDSPADHLRILLVGRDDVASVPDGSAAYVLRSARERMGGVPPNLRPLATLRAFSHETQRAILQLIVRANVAALEARL
jgi:GntR family transcriptional regulator